MAQGHKLRAGRFGEVDALGLAEEIEDMGRAEKRELTNRLAVLLAHLLKWLVQSSHRSRSWSAAIEAQRDQAALILRDNPSLRPLLPEVLRGACRLGARAAMRESQGPAGTFPMACPWSLEQAMAEDFWPETLNPP